MTDKSNRKIKVCAQWWMSLSGSLLATDRSKAVVLVKFLLNVFGSNSKAMNKNNQKANPALKTKTGNK